jgi:hypothetical protein
VTKPDLDRCVYNDDEIRERILERKRVIKQVSALIPDDYQDADAPTQALYGRLVEQVTAAQNDNNLDSARIDFNAFAEQVATDDETGEPLRQAPIHRRWATLCAEHARLLLWSHINSGKTTQISILRTVWSLGRDPTLRICILSNTSSIASKILKAVSLMIKSNDRVKAIFPHLVPNAEGPWTTTELQVFRDSESKDPSVRAVGVHGALTSARVDLLIVDDILDPENCETEASRKKLLAWYKAVAVGRLTRRARIIVVGTAYHPKDLLHDLAKQRGFVSKRFPIIDKNGGITWPEAWSEARIDTMREELGPAEFARQMLCRSRSDDEARFKQEWIDLALDKGNGMALVSRIDELSEEEQATLKVYTGVDLAVSKKKKADKTAFFTFAEDEKGNRRLLSILTGKYTAPEIVEHVVGIHERYGGIIAVENNASQDYILQFAREKSAVPVVPHTTSKAKRDPILGVEGLAIELSNGKWAIPNDHGKLSPEIEAFVTEMLFYTPGAHTGDSLMAAYFAREVARRLGGDKTIPTITVRTIGEDISQEAIAEQPPYREGVDLKKLFAVQ